MSYRVVLQPRARAQLEEQYLYIAASSLAAANRWYDSFLRTLYTLSEFPERCPLSELSSGAGRDIREFHVGRRRGVRRVLFVIEHNIVRVLSIRHAAQGDPPPEDLGDA